MYETLSRRVIDSLHPEGPIVTPAPGDKLDQLLDGIAENHEACIYDFAQIQYLRNPRKCPLWFLPDLEREYGLMPSTALTETERRERLVPLVYKKKSLRTVAFLQKKLDQAGFGSTGYGLIVTPNASPATNPASIVDASYQLTAHEIGEHVSAGTIGAYAAKRAGYYLLNGDQWVLEPIFPMAGQICARAFDGSDAKSGTECAGHYSSFVEYTNEYVSPSSDYWSLIFFIGGTVSRNVDGSIAAVSAVHIPSHRRQELHRLILRYKPLGIWAAMIVMYT